MVDIQTLIPHRPPLLLVDKVTHWDSQSITAERAYTEDEPIFAGHFPDHPILPGVYILEGLAQTSAAWVNLQTGHTAEDSLFYFTGIEGTRFKAPIHPPATVVYHATITKQRAGLYWFEAMAKVGETVCATANFHAKHVVKTPE